MKDWQGYLTQFNPELAVSYRAQGWWPQRTLAEYFDAAVAAYPSKTAIVDRSGRITYAEMETLVDKVGNGLQALGVEPGDVVTAQLPNWREMVIVATACSRIGAVYNGIAPIFRGRDMKVMLELARPKVLVVPGIFRGFDHAAMGARLCEEVPSIAKVVVVGEEVPDSALSWASFTNLSRPGGTSAPAAPDPDAVCQLAFTSGTTGKPKGILHTHNTALASTKAFVDRFVLDANDVFHMASTLGHQTGFLYGLQMPIMTGSTLVLQEVWEPESFVRLVDEEKITMTNGAIPYLADLLRASNLSSHDMSSLRLFGCFGAGLPRPIAIRATNALPNCKVFGGWGMTETGLAVTNLAEDSLELVCDTDGLPVPGTEIRILDDNLSTEAPADVEGELVTRGPLRHLGFVQSELSKTLFLDGDWYVTGDRGRIRPDGRLIMTVRSKDIIVRGGENVPVAEVEALLLEHPSIRSVAVVGIPDERLGEKACACVICEPDHSLDLEELRAFLAKKELTPQYWPELLECFEEFPTTASGKTQKFRLREQLTLGVTGGTSK